MGKNEFLRLALVLGDQSATTVNKYICKIVECVLFDSDSEKLTVIELCKQIKEKYQLEFDILELEKAISAKSGDRIICVGNQYKLSPKALDQLKKIKNPIDLLDEYITQFLRVFGKQWEQELLSSKIQEYIYYAFNSSVENLLSLLEIKPLNNINGFSASNEEVQLINEFIAWDNLDKNKLLYDLVSISYEYCMLTTKKDTLLSRKIFKGKQFLLDTNVIFRMAGINKDERQFVTNSFTKKCREVGIELSYSSETLAELHRVIEGEINYICRLTQKQRPIDIKTLKKIDSEIENNDFYAIYCNWCKSPQNHYDDYLSFQSYLIRLIRNVISNLKFINVQNVTLLKNKDLLIDQCRSLEEFKKEKRPYKPVSQESLKTDISNIHYIYSLRNTNQAQNLWEINDYIVSTDQLLTTWAQKEYSGIPIVVIPSAWLSILLRFAGRSEDDYKAYCLFMGLRQHRAEEEKTAIKSEELLEILAQKTPDVALKQQIIEVILNYKSRYSLDSKKGCKIAVDNAVEYILEKSKQEVTANLTNTFAEREKISNEEIKTLKEQMKGMSTEDDYIIRFANRKAANKIEKWERFKFLMIVVPMLTVVCLFLVFLKIEPIYGIISTLTSKVNIQGVTPWQLCTFFITSGLNLAVIAPIKYLSSDERKQLLVKKYIKESEKYLK